jgi:hypothetical protein
VSEEAEATRLANRRSAIARMREARTAPDTRISRRPMINGIQTAKGIGGINMRCEVTDDLAGANQPSGECSATPASAGVNCTMWLTASRGTTRRESSCHRSTGLMAGRFTR